MSNAHDGGMLVPEATQIETVSGRFVDTLHPDPATIDAADIAHHLAMLCRYGGAVSRFYSVAEHAVLVHDLLRHQGAERELLRAALLHDAAEAYLGDMVSPLKYALRCAEFDYPGAIHRASYVDHFRGAYALLTEGIERAIAERFEIDRGLFDAEPVKLADMWALKIEASALTHTRGANWRWPGSLPNEGALPAGVSWAGGLIPTDARALYMMRQEQLLGSPASDSLRRRILSLLPTEGLSVGGFGLTSVQLARVLGEGALQIDDELRAMNAEGLVEHDGKPGAYRATARARAEVPRG